MHTIITIFVSILFLTGLAEYGMSLPEKKTERRRASDRDAVNKQHEADLKRIEEIKNKMREFLGDINRQLRQGGSTDLDNPVDMDKIQDIKKADRIHSMKKVPAPQFVYANADRVSLRSVGAPDSIIVGYIDFCELVELLAQTERIDEGKEVQAPWILVRRNNGDEGWVYGAYLQKAKPDKKRSPEARDKTNAFAEFDLPVAGEITGRYGYRVDPKTKRSESFHKGIDIAAPAGVPVKASAGGIVQTAGYMRNGYGNLVVIEHERELSTYYGHLSEIRVIAGQRVAKGDVIGTLGSSGNATGPHLHFEVRSGGTAYDPEEFLR